MGAGAEVEKFLEPPGLPHPRHILLPYVQRGAPRPVHRALGVGWAVVLKAKGSESSLLPPHQSADSCALHSLSHLPFAQPHPSTPAPLGFLPPPTADHLLSLSLLCSPPSALGMWWGGGRSLLIDVLRAGTAAPDGSHVLPLRPDSEPSQNGRSGGPGSGANSSAARSSLPPASLSLSHPLCPFSCFSLCASVCVFLSPSLLSHHGN